jgi:hypothetical protein
MRFESTVLTLLIAKIAKIDPAYDTPPRPVRSAGFGTQILAILAIEER